MIRSHALGRVAAVVVTVAIAASCNDANVPFLTAPTSFTKTPTGFNNAITGLFSASRIDAANYIFLMSGFGRDGANFTNTEPRFVTYNTGLFPITNTWIPEWDQEYTDILQGHDLRTLAPQVVPAYTTAQLQAINGVIKTLEALNYMAVAEVHDTLGAAVQTGGPGLATALCNKDVWRYVVALLDTANAELDSAGSTPAPIPFPSGFGAVSARSGPAKTPGSFAAFNRALAAKANLELAYAIARAAGGASVPDSLSPGSPDVAALTSADSAMNQSALYDVTALAPPPSFGWLADAHSVLMDFSSANGDQVNPMNQVYTTFVVLNGLVNSVDTANDLRWKAKFTPIPSQLLPVQQPSYNSIASTFFYDMYKSPGSYIPIVRDEELTLVEAQIQIGLTNYGTAATLINDVRTKAGGLTPLSIGSDYVSTRDALLSEQRISTAFEASGDRIIAIRMYGLQHQLLRTWDPTDTSTTDQQTSIDPIPFTEVSGRGGSWVTTCP